MNPDGQRLLTFEVNETLYALPISCVLEVAESSRVTCIPTLPRRIGGVINSHGDALPVIRSASLFQAPDTEERQPGNVLVIADRVGGVARLGLPVDRVLGLVDGAAAASMGAEVVAERRSIQGRVTSVLDPKRLVAEARNLIENSLGQSDGSQ